MLLYQRRRRGRQTQCKNLDKFHGDRPLANRTTTCKNLLIRWIIRLLRGLKQADHINMKKVRKQINMLSVNQMSVYHTAMEAYNIINRTSSEQLQGKLSRHDGKHSERNNANNELYVPKKPLVKCTGFSYLGPKLYNMLTTEVKSAKSIDDFKTKLMGWIWKNIH